MKHVYLLLSVLAFFRIDGFSQSTPTPFSPLNHSTAVDSIYSWVESRSSKVYQFWKEKAAVDNATDGFFGDINLQGVATKGQRNSIQQGRQLFTVSIWYRFGSQDENTAKIAHNQYLYFLRAFSDPTGGEFYINDSDKPSSANRRLYNSAFSIYGLAHYNLAFNRHSDTLYANASHRALRTALRGFIALDKRAHDPSFPGYQQRPIGSLAANEVSLDGGDKEINTHMHLMEAFTSLYEAWKVDKNAVSPLLSETELAYVEAHLKARLREMIVDVMVDRFCTERGDYAYCRTEFSRNWTLVNTSYLSFSHDIETAWLLMEALRVIDLPEEEALRIRRLAEKLIFTVNRFGFETVGNGIASVARGRISDFAVIGNWKDWWQHFESFAGLYFGARMSNDPTQQALYLQRLKRILVYLDQSGIAVSFGTDKLEYKWNTAGNNTMANQWKAGYHTLRALVFVKEWIDEDRLRTTTNELKTSPSQSTFALLQNYPNPFNPSTRISWIVPAGTEGRFVRLRIFDMMGREVAVPVEGVFPQGQHAILFSGAGLSNGLYLYQLETRSHILTRKMTLLK